LLPKKEDTMLVLSRRLNEKIVSDGGIVVTVVKIGRSQIRLGIEAPSHVGVFRKEITEGSRSGSSDGAVAPGI
jgi:carbon storage regulator